MKVVVKYAMFDRVFDPLCKTERECTGQDLAFALFYQKMVEDPKFRGLDNLKTQFEEGLKNTFFEGDIGVAAEDMSCILFYLSVDGDVWFEDQVGIEKEFGKDCEGKPSEGAIFWK